MAPVTLPVPVLRSLVGERFAVSEFLTSIFMSVNMIGAVIAAPLASCLAPPGKTYYAHPAPWGQSSCPRSTGFR